MSAQLALPYFSIENNVVDVGCDCECNGKSYDRIESSGKKVNERNVLALTSITLQMGLYVRSYVCV